MSQSHLFSGNDLMCRICLVEPGTESDPNQPFENIMNRVGGQPKSKKRMLDLLGIHVEAGDTKSKVICKYCAAALECWDTLRKKATESQIVINYIATKKFGLTTPETSNASTSSRMLMNNEEPSHEPLLTRSQSISRRSNKFGDSMPGTSVASTSRGMLRNNDEDPSWEPPFKHGMLRNNDEDPSWEPPFKRSQSISKRSNKFGDSMPGTPVASTSRGMIRNNEESSQEPKHSQSISKRSNKFGDAMPGTSVASTSRGMIRNNEEPSHEPLLTRSRSISKRSNKFGDSMPGTSVASTSRGMLRNNDEDPSWEPPFKLGMLRNNDEDPSWEPPFKRSQSISKRSNKFGDSMPGTSVASTSRGMIRNNEESSQEPLLTRSRSISKRSNKFGDSMPGTSVASTSSGMLRNNDEDSSWEPPFKHSQSISKRSNKNGTILNGCSTSNNKQGNSITNNSNSEICDSSDDDSCIMITTPIETIELTSDDEDSECDNDNIESSQIEVIELSESEDSENNLRDDYFNNVTEKLYYCSICQKKNILNHDCSQHTKSFFTCLVPCCNILSRSKKDFTFHYQPHIGMSSSGVMCHRCFKGIDQSNIDGNGCHIRCDTANAFKCYLCNVRFNSIQNFAYHKLKTHNGILMDALCNYICLYCEQSSPDILEITDHMKHCLENQAKNITAASMKQKKSSKKETELLPVKINTMKNVMERTNGNNKKILRTSEHVLFTCLKPSCKKIFQSFTNFKNHHRHHFQLGNALVCWQCCKPLASTTDLRAHQAINNCRTPGMYKCYKCSSKFDDVESLSIHKLTFHESTLIAGKKNRKTITCAFCQKDVNIFNFQSHLVTCQKKNGKKNTRATKKNDTYPCSTCDRVFGSLISLSNHSRVHKRIISNLKKE